MTAGMAGRKPCRFEELLSGFGILIRQRRRRFAGSDTARDCPRTRGATCPNPANLREKKDWNNDIGATRAAGDGVCADLRGDASWAVAARAAAEARHAARREHADSVTCARLRPARPRLHMDDRRRDHARRPESRRADRPAGDAVDAAAARRARPECRLPADPRLRAYRAPTAA